MEEKRKAKRRDDLSHRAMSGKGKYYVVWKGYVSVYTHLEDGERQVKGYSGAAL
jgi:CRP-like cAMP-binding protein